MGVVNFCPGSGATFGNAIVGIHGRGLLHSGSKAVGLEIHERAAKARPGQIWIKRTILEMAGKIRSWCARMRTLTPRSKA